MWRTFAVRPDLPDDRAVELALRAKTITWGWARVHDERLVQGRFDGDTLGLLVGPTARSGAPDSRIRPRGQRGTMQRSDVQASALERSSAAMSCSVFSSSKPPCSRARMRPGAVDEQDTDRLRAGQSQLAQGLPDVCVPGSA